MTLDDFFSMVCKETNKDKAFQMAAYMRNQFVFLGIPAPKRKQICKEYIKNMSHKKQINWKFIFNCWIREEREFQYIAIDYLKKVTKKLTLCDISYLRYLILHRSWWDTIDSLDTIVGEVALAFPKTNQILLTWSVDENIWLRRVAIDHQLKRKEKTNPDLLSEIIRRNFSSNEFFINKAIGWSLREYSKTNKQWVTHFLEKYHTEMSALSYKEAKKYIDKN